MAKKGVCVCVRAARDGSCVHVYAVVYWKRCYIPYETEILNQS